MGGSQFDQLEDVLSADLNVKREDLSDGSVDSEADILLLAAPKDLDQTQLFAVDQFLMRGGTVIAATSPFSANLMRNSLSMQRHNSGLDQWLQHHGFKLDEQLVLDPQNSAFPVPVTREVGAFRFQELRMIDYPYFADLRSDGLNRDNPITSGLNQLSMAWASPIKVDSEKNAERHVTELLHSSDHAWLSGSLNIMPQIDNSGRSTFTPGENRGKYLLGVISQGRFSSYFTGKESPLLASIENATAATSDGKADEGENIISSVIEHSPESARIILYASNDFLNDQVMRLSGSANGSQYLGGLQLMANTVDWSMEEQGLLSIRSRGHYNRTLPPMEQNEQLYWESANYVLAVVILIALAAVHRYRRRQKSRRYFEELAV